jgi:hypothetical protein
LLGRLGASAWRWMYLVGVLPALLGLWVWRGMPESARWEAASEQRRVARALRKSGAALAGEHTALTRFTVTDMFLDRSVRGRLIGAFLMMLSVTLEFWGVATFVPTFVGTVASKRACRRHITLQWRGSLAPTSRYSALSASAFAPIGLAASQRR